MKLIPVLTEKSLSLAKDGWYTFKFTGTATKYKLREIVLKLFKVHALKVRKISIPLVMTKDIKGRKKTHSEIKKFLVKLKDDEKIDIFEESLKAKK